MAAAKVINQIQLYGMDSVINATVLYTAVLEPSWNTSASNQGQLTTIQRVGSLELTTHPVGGIEGRLFSVNAVLQVKDQNVCSIILLHTFSNVQIRALYIFFLNF